MMFLHYTVSRFSNRIMCHNHSGSIISPRVDPATDSMKAVFLERYRQLGYDITGKEETVRSLRVNKKNISLRLVEWLRGWGARPETSR